MCQGVFFSCCEQVCSELLFPVVPLLESMRLWSFVTMTRHATWAKVNLAWGPWEPWGCHCMCWAPVPLSVLCTRLAAEPGTERTDRVTAVPVRCGLGAGAEHRWLHWCPGHSLEVTLPPAVQLAGAAEQDMCPGGCVHTQQGDNGPGTMCPGVLWYPAPLALCWCMARCFTSVGRASTLPAPEALVILQ